MYGLENLDDEQLQQLFGALSAQQGGFQAQDLPQITQGLLGSTGNEQAQAAQQQQNLQNVINGGSQAAANMAQVAQSQPSGNNAQMQMEAANQQAIAQQQKQQQQTGALLGQIASMFIPGGSILGFLKKKK